jgi:hypothetical protein
MSQMAGDTEASQAQPGARGGAEASPPPEADQEDVRRDDLVDEMGRGSFPGSDPPSTWAGADRTRR